MSISNKSSIQSSGPAVEEKSVTEENQDALPAPPSIAHNVYEKSVTDKENALINSFSNLIENNSIQDINVVQQQKANIKTNGKVVDYNLLNDDNLIIKSAISNGNNGHSDHNLDNKM